MGANILPPDICLRSLQTVDGRARVERTTDGSGLRVSCDDRLVLELRPADGVLVLGVTNGDLQLRADHGTVSVHAQAVETSAERVTTTATEVDWHVGTWRLSASRIRERAESMTTVVHDTICTRAGRMRSIAKGMFEVLSHRTTMRSKDNTAIDGKRVLLG